VLVVMEEEQSSSVEREELAVGDWGRVMGEQVKEGKEKQCAPQL